MIKGKAPRWSTAHIYELATLDSANTTDPQRAWEKDAPALFKHLLNAERPHVTEVRDAQG